MTSKEELIRKIKEKKELSGLADSLILESINKYLAKRRINIENLRPSEFKILIKDLRAELRNYAGRFQIYGKEWRKRDILLEKGELSTLLNTHTSTQERADFYPELRILISDLKVNSILDLGCGINPIALADSGITYYASDVNKEELDLVNSFFKKNNIKGRTFLCDLRKIEEFDFPQVDLCLIFKVLDIIEKKSTVAEKLLNKIKAKYFLISFSTKTLSGRHMEMPRRLWLEKLLSKLNYSFKTIKSKNEIFYLITNTN